jgi:hypothetical protein
MFLSGTAMAKNDMVNFSPKCNAVSPFYHSKDDVINQENISQRMANKREEYRPFFEFLDGENTESIIKNNIFTGEYMAAKDQQFLVECGNGKFLSVDISYNLNNKVSEFFDMVFDEIKETGNYPSAVVQKNSLAVLGIVGGLLNDIYPTANDDKSITIRGSSGEKNVSVDVYENDFFILFYKRVVDSFTFVYSGSVMHVGNINELIKSES